MNSSIRHLIGYVCLCNSVLADSRNGSFSIHYDKDRSGYLETELFLPLLFKSCALLA